jgi:hypothetical protein
MNEFELKKLWQNTNDNLDSNFVIGNRTSNDLNRVKIKSRLSQMKPVKIFTIIIGILWVGIGTMALSWIYVNTFSGANKFFLFSATVQVLLTAIALIIYIYQLIKIYQVEIYDPILQTQKKLAKIKISTLWAARILSLQLPVWTTFWWKKSMLTEFSTIKLGMILLITVTFTIAALWLFFNIKYERRNTKWFKFIFQGKEWTPLIKSIELLDQIEEFDIVTNTTE